MTKIPQKKEELKKHFEEQLRFIEKSSIAYDNGDLDEAKRIATSLRLLFHHTDKSIPLLSQLGLDKTTKFIDTKLPDFQSGPIITYHGLISVSFGEDHYVPNLGKEPISLVNYDNYWEKEIVLIDKKGNNFTRKDIVCEVANTDGGAHVDPTLKTKYSDLSRNNSIGWITQNNFGEVKQLYGAALATIRQIGHEVLLTFNPNYEAEHKGNKIFISGLQITTEPIPTYKIDRNDLCPCGSGKKWKKCGYLNTQEHQLKNK